MASCRICSYDSVDDTWRYCANCGIPVRDICPYSGDGSDSDHTIPIGTNGSRPGRCPTCGKVVRYCPTCGRIHTIRDVACREHQDITLEDCYSGYTGIGGGVGLAGNVDGKHYVFCSTKDDTAPPSIVVGEPILPPIAAYGFIYCFLPDSRVLLRIDESLDPSNVCRSRNLGSGYSDSSVTNLAAGMGLVSVLLDDQAILLDAISLDHLCSVAGRFSSHVLTESTWYLLGISDNGAHRAVATDTRSLEILFDAPLNGVSAGFHQRPISDGKDLYILDSGTVLRIGRTGNQIGIDRLIALPPSNAGFGQMILCDDKLLTLSGGRDLVSIDLNGQVSQKPLAREAQSDRLWVSGQAVAVLQSSQITLVDTDCNEMWKHRLPAQARVNDLVLMPMMNVLAIIVHTVDGMGFDNFACCLDDRPDSIKLRVAATNAKPGFLCADGAVFVYSRRPVRNDQILRIQVGKRQ